MRDEKKHRNALLNQLHEYVCRTLEPLEKKIQAGKLDEIRTDGGIHKAWVNQTRDNWRHEQVEAKRLEEIPVSDLPEPRQTLVQHYINSNGDPNGGDKESLHG